MNSLKTPLLFVFAALILMSTFTAEQQAACPGDEVLPTLVANMIKLADAQTGAGGVQAEAAQQVRNSLQELNARCYGTPVLIPVTNTPIPAPTATLVVIPPAQSVAVTVKNERGAGVFLTPATSLHIGDLPRCALVSIEEVDNTNKWTRVDHVAQLAGDNPLVEPDSGWIFANLLAIWFKGNRYDAPGTVEVFTDETKTESRFSLSANQSFDVLEMIRTRDDSKVGINALLQIRTDTGEGWVEADPFFPEMLGRYVSIDEGINVRSGPDLTSAKLVDFSRLTVLKVLSISEDGAWLQVERHIRGWVDSSFLRQDFPADATLYTRGAANLRSERILDDDRFIIGSIGSGSRLTVIDRSDPEWLRVTSAGMEGWVNRCNVTNLVPE